MLALWCGNSGVQTRAVHLANAPSDLVTQIVADWHPVSMHNNSMLPLSTHARWVSLWLTTTVWGLTNFALVIRCSLHTQACIFKERGRTVVWKDMTLHPAMHQPPPA
jgi:hypothetical protein